MRGLRLGTRGSALATTQSGTVADDLRALGFDVDLVIVKTEGDDLRVPLDAPSRPGAFVATLRDRLLAADVDLVVHSFKDLPSAPLDGLTIAAVPRRADPRDVLVTRDGRALADLPGGAVVGTSSPRRAAALLRSRPDLVVVPLRGNVDTRVAEVFSGRLDATILAAAGLERLGRAEVPGVPISTDVMLPAPAQGALAVECRADDHDLVGVLRGLDHLETRLTVTAERAVLAGVEAACTTAVGALADLRTDRMVLSAELTNHAGVAYRRVEVMGADESSVSEATDLGARAARDLLLT